MSSVSTALLRVAPPLIVAFEILMLRPGMSGCQQPYLLNKARQICSLRGADSAVWASAYGRRSRGVSAFRADKAPDKAGQSTYAARRCSSDANLLSPPRPGRARVSDASVSQSFFASAQHGPQARPPLSRDRHSDRHTRGSSGVVSYTSTRA